MRVPAYLASVNTFCDVESTGLEIKCGEVALTITAGRQFFEDRRVPFRPEYLRLGANSAQQSSCRPVESESEMVISAGLQACGTESSVQEEWLVYSNQLLLSAAVVPTSTGSVMVKGAAAVIPVECRYKRKQTVNGEPLTPTWLPMTSTISVFGLLRFSLRTMAGLLALLLIVLEWTRPGLPSPLRPICDLRVLNHFIKEARDAEVVMKSCREGCSLSESVTVPQTRVEFDVWENKTALSSLRTSVTNTALHSHIDNSIRNLLSINAVLRSLNIQEYTPPASTAGLEGTWRVSSATDLLQIHVNFLRGKVRLLLLDAQACQQDVS
ncbi:hypothetical protein L3Q82_004095 [Scortum barcoo]|uniref:Uncharacterized protein n=1 Tax=Scortum barcoo TaxID=214431 RepID=A0ACB8X6Y7_9TELE|nr:hypothetical protein L3Q82_004095 [Scortum barcoo]